MRTALLKCRQVEFVPDLHIPIGALFGESNSKAYGPETECKKYHLNITIEVQ